MWIEIFGLISTALAVTGVVLNNNKKAGCFYLWIFSNAICFVLHAVTGLYSLCLRDFIFFLLAFDGINKWRVQ